MGSLVLTVGTGSTWAMRAALVLAMSGLEWQEQVFDLEDAKALARLKRLAPAGLVPWLDHDGVRVHDSLVIAEYLYELCPDRQLYPASRAERALARSLCAEMHSGFSALRGACPMNIEADLAQQGALLWRDRPAVRADVQRLIDMWGGLLTQYGGPMLFGQFSIADAFYAPVCMRVSRYGLPVPKPIAQYIQRVEALSAMQEWIAAAKAEQDFREFEEPYRLER